MSRRSSLVSALAHFDPAWVKQQFDCLEDEYFLRFSEDEIAEHLSVLQGLHQTEMSVQIEPKGSQFQITLITYDLTGLFPILCGTLAYLDCVIDSGSIYTYQPPSIKIRKAVIDTLLVKIPEHKNPEDLQTEIAEQLKKWVGMAKTEGMNKVRDGLHGFIGKKLSLENSAESLTLLPVQIDIDHDARWTWLDIQGQDTPAFLFLLSNSLTVMGYSIQKVEIRTHLSQVHDRIWITDREDKPLVRNEQLEKIRTTVALTKQFSHYLPQAGNYESAFKNFYQFIHQSLSDESALNQFKSEKSLSLMANIFGSGDFLWESFTKMQMENMIPLLKSQHEFKIQKSRADYIQIFKDLTQNLSDFDSKIDAINQFKDKELFRIDLGHLIYTNITFADFADQLTLLAEATLASIAELCYLDVVRRMGEPQWDEGLCPWSILALGKFGGRELGYASDLELMVVFAQNGKTSGENSDSNQEFFNRVVKKIRTSFRAKTDGIFELDFRLSPYATEGTLACSFSTWQEYFSVGGAAHDVERQALVRMRPVYGDSGLSQSLVHTRNRIIYMGFKPNKEEFLRLQSVQKESHIQSKNINAKYSQGGLVEIEYPLQWIQMEYGAQVPALTEVTSCIKVMEILLEQGIITPTTFEKLYNAYAFLRRLINALRMVRGNAKDMVLPDSQSPEFNYLARRLQYSDAQTGTAAFRFHRDLQAHMQNIHQFFKAYFYESSVKPKFAPGLPELVFRQMDDDVAEEFLHSIGIVDADKIRLMLQRLFDMLQDKNSLIAVLVMATRWIRRSPHPDAVFLAFEKFLLNAEEHPGFVQQLLYSPQAIRIVVAVFGQSRYLSDVLANESPLLMQINDLNELKIKKSRHQCLEDLEQRLFGVSDYEARLEVIRSYRNREYLRIGLRDFHQLQPMDRITSELSDLSDALILAVYREVFTHSKAEHLLNHLVLIAMGKLGGAEINYSSDIDIVFVLTHPQISSDDKILLDKTLVRLLKALSASSRYGQLFRVDTTLRPYGAQGGLLGSIEHYDHYYNSEADGWERQIWLKARSIAGDIHGGDHLIQKRLSEALSPQNADLVRKSIVDFRIKVLERLKRKEQLYYEVKSGPGGIRVVEFLVQGLQMQQGHLYPEIISGSTQIGLKMLVKVGLLNAEYAEVMESHYVFLRRIEHILQLDELAQEHLLPSDDAKRKVVALRMGFEDRLGESALTQFDNEYARVRLELLTEHTRVFPEIDLNGFIV